MEYYQIRGVPSILANVAWGSDTKPSGEWRTKAFPYTKWTNIDPHWGDKVHIWRMDWDENYIRLYLDDELLNEVSLTETINGEKGQKRNPFKQPHYILLNLALGGNNGGPIDNKAFPMDYEVDYVRVYQRR
jgi:beta-glucanase (GH16 family)